MESVRLMMVQYGQTIKMPSNPKDVTYEKCVEILQDNSTGIAIRELFEIALQRNQQISEYIGKNLSMEHNFKVKTVVNMLRNHSRIREVNSRPILSLNGLKQKNQMKIQFYLMILMILML